MTDPVEKPAEAPDPNAAPAEVAAPKPRRPVLPLVVGIGFLVLAASQAALWFLMLHPLPGIVPPDPRLAAIEARLSTLEARPTEAARLSAISARVTALEQRQPASAASPQAIADRIAADLAPLTARVTALEQRQPASAAAQALPAGVPAELAAVTARVTALEQRPPAAAAAQAQSDGAPTGLAALTARVTALEQRPPAAAAAPAQPDGAPAELAALTARVTTLEQRQPALAAASSGLGDRVAADEARLAALEKASAVPAQLADRAARVARLQAAFAALAAGQSLGEIPGAPPALARYANTTPPTEPGLRLAFPAAAQAALAAAHPSSAGKPFLDRMWAEAQDLVTIRQGDHVLLGDPDAGVLAHAQTALDAGDLAGAAAAVATLTGPAAKAMAPWLDQARGLLAARAALADLAAHA